MESVSLAKFNELLGPVPLWILRQQWFWAKSVKFFEAHPLDAIAMYMRYASDDAATWLHVSGYGLVKREQPPYKLACTDVETGDVDNVDVVLPKVNAEGAVDDTPDSNPLRPIIKLMLRHPIPFGDELLAVMYRPDAVEQWRAANPGKSVGDYLS